VEAGDLADLIDRTEVRVMLACASRWKRARMTGSSLWLRYGFL